MSVLNNYAMKAFQVNLAEIVAIICWASIGIRIVLGIPEEHIASDDRKYLIETKYQVIYYTESHICIKFFIKNLQFIV